MNILIICTYFPPDSTIAAVRPYMFAKYLTQAGHKVTVLRSGEFYSPPDDSYPLHEQRFRIITYLGSESPAERYEKGTYVEQSEKPGGKTDRIPQWIKKTAKFCLNPVVFMRGIRRIKKRYTKMQEAIDRLTDESWDIVFSTYGNLENIWGGQYASKKLNAKWIMDFRDPVVCYDEPLDYTWNYYASGIQKHAVQNADICTAVSEGLKERLIKSASDAHVITLYNGYDADNLPETEALKTDRDHLTFCYLGTIYKESARALDLLLRALNRQIDNGEISKNKLRFIFGGKEEEEVKTLFEKNHMGSVLEWVGYVDRNTALRIQQESDIFLVLSWNTQSSQGVLTGKFYEGIRANKPILAVIAGNVPNSELRKLNQLYHFGFCFEESMALKEQQLFSQYILDLYNEKMKSGKIPFVSNKALAQAFRYDCLSAKLETMMASLIN